jgi:hypothetical protein
LLAITPFIVERCFSNVDDEITNFMGFIGFSIYASIFKPIQEK